MAMRLRLWGPDCHAQIQSGSGLERGIEVLLPRLPLCEPRDCAVGRANGPNSSVRRFDRP